MTQEQALHALEELDEQVSTTDRWWSEAAVANIADVDDPKTASRTLLRCTRNCRAERHWFVRGGPGSGLYGYGITDKGRGYLAWLDNQSGEEEAEDADGYEPEPAQGYPGDYETVPPPATPAPPEDWRQELTRAPYGQPPVPVPARPPYWPR